ncbi:hypothetical protein Pmani_012355 [Petrolisthes manimaculis]|uniref:Transmembrane protein n=1 Tax=Petrolisthes manimaculis TaxID=1843537 RepID=A0AAE1PY13_9EUCA|nr:hypothetical protein Pmani_012355 [Petrolisthes manimaculis]
MKDMGLCRKNMRDKEVECYMVVVVVVVVEVVVVEVVVVVGLEGRDGVEMVAVTRWKKGYKIGSEED